MNWPTENSPLKYRHLVTLVLVVAFSARLAAAGWWHWQAAAEGTLFRVGDSLSYWVLAEQIASGRPYEYGSENASVFRAPLYPILLAPFTWLGDQAGVLAARCFGCCLGTLSVAGLMLLTYRAQGRIAALACGTLAAFYPSAVGMSVVILSEAVFVPLMTLQFIVLQCLLADAADRQTATSRLVVRCLWAGAIAGLCVLARPSWLLFLPFCATVFFIAVRRLQIAQLGLLALIGLCVTMLPWWIRNASVTDRFVPTTLQVGPSLYDGLHEGATGASDEGMQFMQRFLAEQLEEDSRTTSPLESTLEYRLNRRAQRAAIAWAGDHPGEVARLAWIKFLRTWSLWPDGGDIGSPAVRLAVTFSCFTVLLIAISGTITLVGQRPLLALLVWLPCLYFTLLHMVFVGSIRYREPAVYLLTVPAGIAVAGFINWYLKPNDLKQRP